jgi:L,D-peptidoglycan transpeptidase YkuD (ErfK/YbiS/YcfS/YnhG family)
LGFALVAWLPLGTIHLLDSSRLPSHARTRVNHLAVIPAASPASQIAGLGKSTADRIPTDSDQVVLVEGDRADSSRNTVSLWRRSQTGWREILAAIPGYNGASGWTAHHRSGDRRTPIGVFSLTEAGGALPNPGTSLPYQHNSAYYGRSIYLGDRRSSVFDYVVAINFNRLPNAPPSNPAEPLGAETGGGIWLHVADGEPTEGCVSLPRPDMVKVLRWLKTGLHPVIVMGDRASLTI